MQSERYSSGVPEKAFAVLFFFYVFVLRRVIDMDDPMRNEKLEKVKEAGEILLTSVK